MTAGPAEGGPGREIPDPRATYESAGEKALRERLEALDRDGLETVVQTYPPHHTPPPALDALSDAELVGYIVDGARRESERG